MKRNPDKMERDIIAAARQQFLEKGFEQTKMGEIALSLKISRPKLHYYFRTKDILFQAVFADIVGSLIPPVQDILTSQVSFFEKLDQIVEVYFTLFTRYPQIPRFMVNEINRDLPHIIVTIKSLGVEPLLSEVLATLDGEMSRGTIKRVPVSMIFSTFYSSLTFPFLSNKLISQMFFDDKAQLQQFHDEWKRQTVRQMKTLFTEAPVA